VSLGPGPGIGFPARGGGSSSEARCPIPIAILVEVTPPSNAKQMPRPELSTWLVHNPLWMTVDMWTTVADGDQVGVFDAAVTEVRAP
jgi:hypothetical protein